MANLFTPFKLREIQFKNRIVVSPMCEYSSEDGFANDWHLVHLGTRAVGGAALVIAEATAVSPEARITPSDLGLWKDEHIPVLQKITSFIHMQDAIAGIQLAHAGRKASRTEPWNGNTVINREQGGWRPFAPSAVPLSDKDEAPEALTQQGIIKVIADFKAAAQRALQAGFKLIEIHAAHGYLINEFLSPLTNKRTDEYGGSFENRTRLLFNIIAAIRETWPLQFPLFVRISASDWIEGGWTIEDSVALAEELKKRQVDLVDCSSGGLIPTANIPAAPGYQVHFAEIIRKKDSDTHRGRWHHHYTHTGRRDRNERKGRSCVSGQGNVM